MCVADRPVGADHVVDHPVDAERLAVVDDHADGDALGQFRQAADVVVVQVRGDEDVDPVHACRAERGHHAAGLAPLALAAPVDEHRLAVRGDEQRTPPPRR